jgi:hypothetical protein
MGPNESKGVTPPPKHHVEIDDVTDDMMMFNPCPSFVDSEHEIIVPMNINGSFLPMEKRPGENKYRIPSFVLSHPPQK